MCPAKVVYLESLTFLASLVFATTDMFRIILFGRPCQYPIAYSTKLQAILTASEYVGYACIISESSYAVTRFLIANANS